MEHSDDDELRKAFDALRERARNGESLDDLLYESFALTRKAAEMTLGQRHFDVQMIGGMVLHDGEIAEMKTGEGKTLTATLSVVLNALAGDGVHVVTVNDYLARRDAEWMGADLRRARRDRRRAAEHAALRGEAGRLRRRRHLRHQLRVRLRLPARQHGHVARREGPARRPPGQGRQAPRAPRVRDRRRGRQHPHRRGPHPADHLRRARAGRRPLRASLASRRCWRPARSPRASTRARRRSSSPTTTTSSTRSTRPSRSPRAAWPRPRSSLASTTCTAPRTATSSTT